MKPEFAPMSQRERLFHHSLSNTAFAVVAVLWLVLGYWLYNIEHRMQTNRNVREALVNAVTATGQTVIVCDEQGKILMASTQAESVFGVALTGKHVHDFARTPEVRARADKAFNELVADVKKSGKPVVLTLDHVVVDIKGPKHFTMTVRVVPENNNSVSIVATLTPKEFIRSLPGSTDKPSP